MLLLESALLLPSRRESCKEYGEEPDPHERSRRAGVFSRRRCPQGSGVNQGQGRQQGFGRKPGGTRRRGRVGGGGQDRPAGGSGGHCRPLPGFKVPLQPADRSLVGPIWVALLVSLAWLAIS